MTGHVFVSHGSEDSEDANALAAFIESKGVKSWIAPRDVRPGQDYSEQLQEAIETSIAFVVLVSDKANRSPYVRAETEMAFSNGKPIFPVRVSDIQPAAGLAFFLKIRHWTDAFGPGREASLARLAREVQTVAGVPVDAAPSTIPPTTTPPPAVATPAPAPPPPAPAPPQATPAALMAAPAPVDEALLPGAIGPNAAYYQERWRQMDAKGSSISWNWPACLVSGFWFAYRKMWLPLIVLVIVNVLISAAGASNPDFGKVSLLLTIGITFITGTFGNHLYRKHVQRLIAETSTLPRDMQAEALQKRGGVSQAAVFILIGITLLAVLIGVIAAASKINQMPGAPPYPDNGFQPLVDPNAPQPDPNAPPSGEKPPLTDEEIRSLQQQGY
jgi:hypothetical protein